MNWYGQQFNGKNILVVFSDPGGAKPLLALLDLCLPSAVRVVSDREYPFYGYFKTPVEKFHGKINAYFDNRIDLLLTGTSYTSDLEVRFLEYAQQSSISSISFVDHYTNIRKRFQHASLTAYPNKLWVLDETAETIALADGFNKSELTVMSNPYSEWLRFWKPTINREIFMAQLGLKEGDYYLLYAPDPLSNVDGMNTFGFDEVSVNADLLQLPEAFGHIVINAHPNQKIENFDVLLQDRHFGLAPQNIDTNHLIYHSEIVMGFFSSILLEAQLLGKKVYRYIPENAKADPFENRHVGDKINTLSKLISNTYE